jgi:L-fuculose-phosphate aldolase
MSQQNIQELKERVALANRTLHHQGLTTFLGHASIRIPGTDRILIKPRPHVSMDRVTADMIMTLDLEGNIVDAPKGAIIPAEWPLHTEIYKARPEVGGVIHTHQKWCSVFGIAGVTILPVQHPGMSTSVVPPYPVYQESYDIVKTVEQAKVVAKTLGDGVGCHLRTHGMVFVGLDIQKAVTVAVNAERQAEMNWLAMQVGERESIGMRDLRDAVDARFVPRGDEVRQGVPRGAWNVQTVWADENREVYRHRVVQL